MRHPIARPTAAHAPSAAQSTHTQRASGRPAIEARAPQTAPTPLAVAAPPPLAAPIVAPGASHTRAPEPLRATPVRFVPALWECVREADRALVRNDATLALRSIDRCASSTGSVDATLAVRRVAALCMAGRDDEARSVARELLAGEPSAEVSYTISRTCARSMVGGLR